MTDEERKNIRGLTGCSIMMSEILICTAIGGYYGWPIGTGLFGVLLLGHTLNGWRKLRKP